MVTTIEGQIRAVAVAREEQRCLDLEAKTGKPVTRREVPPFWKRPGPCALLQDPDWLQYVTEFDYKLTNKAFQKYCKERGVLHVAGVPGSRRWEYYRDHSKTHEQFMSDPFFRCAEPHDGKRYQFSPDELATQWRIVGLGRAALQDAWELYRAEIGDKRKKPAAKKEPKKAKPRRATKNTTGRKAAENRGQASKGSAQLDLFDGVQRNRRKGHR